MHSHLRRRVLPSLVAAVLFGAGCYCTPDVQPPDAGPKDAGTAVTDSGTPATDAGPQDAGSPDAGPGDAGSVDAGTDAGTDAGSAGTDAGTDAGADAGSGTTDAGQDAGSGTTDAGQDAGSGATDAGQDAGSGATDAGHDAGTVVPDAGVDAGVPDAGCAGLALLDGGCGLLSWHQLCDLQKLTTLTNGITTDDTAGIALGAAMVGACVPTPAWRVVDTRDSGVVALPSGAPLVGPPETLVCGGGGYFQKHVGWLEGNGYTAVKFKSFSGADVSFVLRDGGVLASEPWANFDGGYDFFVLELVRGGPTGPNALVGYGLWQQGTPAAAWYFTNVLVPARDTTSGAWVVVKWLDTDGNGQASTGDTFQVLGLGD